jgi:hypothetical protein
MAPFKVRLAVNRDPRHPRRRWRNHEPCVRPVRNNKPPTARTREPDNRTPAPAAELRENTTMRVRKVAEADLNSRLLGVGFVMVGIVFAYAASVS